VSRFVFADSVVGFEPLRTRTFCTTDIVALFVGIGIFAEPNGITRAMQILMNYFGDRGVLLTNDVTALRSHPIRAGRLYRFRISGRTRLPTLLPWPLSRGLARRARSMIGEYLGLAKYFYQITHKEKVNRICLNTVYQLHALSFLLLAIKLLNNRIKITVIIYDLDELAWCRNKAVVKLLLNSGLLHDVITVDTSMRVLLKRIVTRVPVFAVGFGVSADLLKLARTSPGQIKSGIRPWLPALLSEDKQSIVIIFHGRIIARRRLEDLISAFSRLQKIPDTRRSVLYVAGYTEADKPYVRRLKTLTHQLGCHSVTRFLPSLTTEELAYFYHSSDIFVFPAVQQPWGLAPLEAMAFGKPVIITEECGLSGILRSNNLALIVRARDVDGLCRNLELLVRDEGMRHKLGTEGRVFVEQNMMFYHTGRELERAWAANDTK